MCIRDSLPASTVPCIGVLPDAGLCICLPEVWSAESGAESSCETTRDASLQQRGCRDTSSSSVVAAHREGSSCPTVLLPEDEEGLGVVLGSYGCALQNVPVQEAYSLDTPEATYSEHAARSRRIDASEAVAGDPSQPWPCVDPGSQGAQPTGNAPMHVQPTALSMRQGKQHYAAGETVECPGATTTETGDSDTAVHAVHALSLIHI